MLQLEMGIPYWLDIDTLEPTEEDPDQASRTKDERSSLVRGEEEADSGLSTHLPVMSMPVMLPVMTAPFTWTMP